VRGKSMGLQMNQPSRIPPLVNPSHSEGRSAWKDKGVEARGISVETLPSAQAHIIQ
jgi:hypothetical protein